VFPIFLLRYTTLLSFWRMLLLLVMMPGLNAIKPKGKAKQWEENIALQRTQLFVRG